MNEDIDVEKIRSLERRIGVIEEALVAKGMGYWVGASSPPPPPPPPRPFGAGPKLPPSAAGQKLPPVSPFHQSVKPMDQNPINEDFIGRRVLPVVGALLLLGALAYWAPIAYRSVSPQISFALELIASIAFFALGRWQRNARASFGDVLSGLGAGGVLVTISSGSLFHHLYNNQTMIELALIASVAIGAFGTMIKSRVFVSIGAVGGLLSAWAPTMQGHFYLSMALEAFIVAATLAVFVQSKWRLGIGVLWPISLVVSSPILFQHGLDWRWQVAFLDLLGLEFAIAFALVSQETEFGLEGAFSVLTISYSVLGSVFIKKGESAAAHLAIFGAAIAACGLLFANRPEKRSIFWSVGAIVIGCMAPFGLAQDKATQIVDVLSAVIVGAALLRRSPVLTLAAAVELTVATTASVVNTGPFTTNRTWEALVLISSIVAWMVSLKRIDDDSKFELLDPGFVVAGLAGLAIVWSLTSSQGVPLGTDAASSGLSAIWALILLAISYGLGVKGGRVTAYFLLAGILCKVLLVDLSSVNGMLRSAILTLLGLIMLAGGYIAVRAKSSSDEDVPKAA